MSRRTFLTQSAGLLAGAVLGRSAWSDEPARDLKLATFRFDVTPPKGHSLCGGWITPVQNVETPLQAIGLVILGAGQPIVLCAVDWTGLLNSAHVEFRKALAAGAGTTPDRVAVQCVHPHDAPFACLDAQKIVAQYPELPAIVDVEFFGQLLRTGQDAVAAAIPNARPLTHIATAKAPVKEVAANRRILGPDGRVKMMRGSSCADPALRAEPEGLIDPDLRTIAFYSGDERIAACHYYACHPMSHYGKGQVSPDFCGLARQLQQEAEPGCTHLYFNGCGGNVAAGKYNDGTPAMRPVLRDRILAGMQASLALLKREPVQTLSWSTCEILPGPAAIWKADEIRKQIADPTQPVVARNRPAYTVAWLDRCAAGGPPIVLSGLHLNGASVLHLPAESFIEYQLRAQQLGAGRFVACAAYGDGGPWYIPTREAYPQGGYEVSVAWCDAGVDDVLTQGIQKLLRPA